MSTVIVQAQHSGFPGVRSQITQTQASMFGLSASQVAVNKQFKEMEINAARLRERSQGVRREVSLLRNDFLLGAFAISGFTSAIMKSVTVSARYQSSLTGLNSVALNTGNILNATKQAAMDLSADGLLTLQEASASLKNLLATGFGLDRAIVLMKAFKDFSSFNRQGALGFGEAIIGATEGLKNQNSMLVDNVGLTKNLSVIMKQYGYRIQDLGDESKKAGAMYALYFGLLQESKLVTGDAQKVLETYTGRMSQFEAVVNRTNVALGTMFIESGKSEGVFNTGLTMLNAMSLGFKSFLEINKDMIKVKIKTYFDELIETIKGLTTIVKVAISPFLFLFDLFANTGVGKVLIFALTIRKLAETMKHFVPEGIAAGWMQQTLAASKYRAGLEAVNVQMEVLSARSKIFSANSNLPSGFSHIQRRAVTDMGNLQIGSNGIEPYMARVQVLRNVVDLQARATQFAGSLNTVTAAGLPLLKIQRDELVKAIDYVKTQSPNIGKKLEATIGNVIRSYDVAVTRTNLLANRHYSMGQVMSSAWYSISSGVSRAALAMKGFIMANLPLIAIYGTITALSYAWDKFNEKNEKQKELNEQTNRLLTEEATRKKDAFENRLSELKSVEDKAKSYKELADKVNKTTEEYSTMLRLETTIRSTLNIQADGLKSVGDMAKYATGEIEKQSEALIKQRISQLKGDYYSRTRSIGTALKTTGGGLINELNSLSGERGYGGQQDLNNLLANNTKNTTWTPTGGMGHAFIGDEAILGGNLIGYANKLSTELDSWTKKKNDYLEQSDQENAKYADNRITQILAELAVLAKYNITADYTNKLIEDLQKKGDKPLLPPVNGKKDNANSLADLLLRMKTERDILKGEGSLAEAFAREQGKLSGFELDFNKIFNRKGDKLNLEDIKQYNVLFKSLNELQTTGLLENIDSKIRQLQTSTADFEGVGTTKASKLTLSWEKETGVLKEQQRIISSAIIEKDKLTESEIAWNEALKIRYNQLQALFPFYDKQYIYNLNLLELEEKLVDIENKRKKAETDYQSSSAYSSLRAADKITGLNISNLPNLYSNLSSAQQGQTVAELAFQADPMNKTLYDKLSDAKAKVADANKAISDSFSEMAVSVADSFNTLLASMDIFGTKQAELMSGIRANKEVDLVLQADQYRRDRIDLMNQYENKNITYAEYARQEELMRKRNAKQTELINIKAQLDEKHANDLRSIDQKIAIGQFLETESIKFMALAAAYSIAALVDPFFWAQAGGFAAAGAALGASAASWGTAGLISQRAGIDAKYRQDTTIAERNAQVSDYGAPNTGTATDSGGRSLGGTITAQELKITIAPVITIEGQTIIMSNIGIQEASMIMGEQTVKRIQDAINNKELTFANIS